MTSSFFSDLEEGSAPQTKASFFSDLEEGPSRTRSILSALPKGALKGAQGFKEQSPLRFSSGIPKELGDKVLERFLPTQKGKVAEDVLEFAGENIPLVALGEGGLVAKGAQALSGGLAKKGAKELNLPEWAQELIGTAGMVAPSALKAAGSKALRPAGNQMKIVEFLKSKGLSDKDITPIIQDKKKLSFLSKGAAKFEKREPWFRAIKEKLGGVFEDIRDQGRQAGYLQGKELSGFEGEFFNKLDKVPRMYKRLIQKEVDDLFQNPIDFTELHDFNKAVNAIVGDVQGGRAAIGILKEPIEAAQKKMNPSLYKDLKKTNEAYSKLANFTDRMTKKNWESLLSLGQVGGALTGFLTLNPALIKAAGITAGARLGIKQLLSNPRLQNIHLKMWDSFLNNKIPAALKLAGLFNDELEKEKSK